MRRELSEWYPLTADERTRVLEHGVFAFDANSLLTLYRMSRGDRDSVLELLGALHDQIWVSHRASFEFQRNRLGVYYEQLDAYSSLKKEFDSLRSRIISAREHPVLSQQDIRTEITDRLQQLEKYICDTQVERHPGDLADPTAGDGVRDGLDTVFDGRVGPPHEMTSQRLQEAKRRLDAKIPPGFEDHRKPEPDCYGDYLVWSETLDYLKTRQEGPGPLLFVTEEKKADWWLFSPRRQIIGPRPELVVEAAQHGVTPLWLLSLGRFYETLAAHLNWDVPALGGYASADTGSSTTADSDPKPKGGEGTEENA